MRYCSWLLIWLMVLKMSLGTVMAMSSPNANPWQGAEANAHEVSATTDHPVHLATLSDCHGHAINTDEVKGLKTNSSSEDTDAPPGHSGNCHHCCAVGLGRGPHMAQQPSPATHPSSPPQDWQSANLRPVLRPPIA